MTKKTKNSAGKRKTAAQDLLDKLASTNAIPSVATLDKNFKRSGSEKVSLLKSVEKLASQGEITLDGKRLGEFLALFASSGFTQKSFHNFVETSFCLARSSSSPDTIHAAESSLLKMLVKHCIKPPKGYGKVQPGLITQIVCDQQISPVVVAQAIQSGSDSIKDTAARIPWLTGAVCGLINQKRVVSIEEIDKLVSGIACFPQQDMVLSPLVVSVAFLQMLVGRSADLASLIGDGEPPKVLQPLGAIPATNHDNQGGSLILADRLKTDLKNREAEINKLNGEIRRLKSDLNSRIRNFEQHERESQNLLSAKEKELDEAHVKVAELQEDARRQNKFANEREKLQKREYANDLEKRLVKPANDSAILLKRMLEGDGADPKKIQRLGINFSKLHREINRLAESDNSHELSSTLLKSARLDP